MKAKCCVCGEEFQLESVGHGMYQMSEAMKEHQKEHNEKVSWELTDVEKRKKRYIGDAASAAMKTEIITLFKDMRSGSMVEAV